MILTPLRAIRKYCVRCSNNQSLEIKLCPNVNCPFYNHRLGRGGGRILRLIRKRCLDCGNGGSLDVKTCIHSDCALYTYRFGKNPKLKGHCSPKALEALKKARGTAQTSKKTIVEKDSK